MTPQTNYNPDVLSCLANLSNDEVFTPPSLANLMLDLLPADLWSNKNAKFLDPVSKSGVFLREIAKRLMVGLETQMPDPQARINHIFGQQLFGIAITELTSLLSRRSVYCSKTANGKYSVCQTFDDEQGNIRFERTPHAWHNGKCTFCGANQQTYDRDDALETYAYQFIHTQNPEKIFDNMKFDVIIGNPPYQLTVGVEKENYAVPLYHSFIEQAIKLNPRYLSMIVPARWFTGGRGLDEFRKNMLNDKRLKVIVDYTDSRDCFPGVDVSGGIMYFLWDKHHNGSCEFTNINGSKKNTLIRKLDKYPIFPRYNDALSIIDKVLKKTEKSMSDIISAQTPFGLYTNFKGLTKASDTTLKVYTSKGISFVNKSEITKGISLIDKYKVSFSKATTEHGGQTNKSGLRQVLSTIKILEPNFICTQSYLLAGTFEAKVEAENMVTYLSTKFVRFLIVQAITSQDLSRDKFCFVPIQDFNESWTDEKLYKKYGLTQEEIAFIESMIRPMELQNEGKDA